MSTTNIPETNSRPAADAQLVDELAPHIAREIQDTQRYSILLRQDGDWTRAMRFKSLDKARSMADTMSRQTGLDVEGRDQNGNVQCSFQH